MDADIAMVNEQVEQSQPAKVSFERAVRKKRATNEIIKEFVMWCFNNNAFETCTNGRIRQMYIEEKGIDLTISTIKNQRGRWLLHDGQLYDRNKGWMIPNIDESK